MSFEEEVEDECCVELVSCEGEIIQVDRCIAMGFGIIEDMFDLVESHCPIPLPNLSSKVLKLLINYIKHTENGKNAVVCERCEESGLFKFTPWFEECLPRDQPGLVELLMASRYAHMPALSELLFKALCNFITGRTNAQLMKVFSCYNQDPFPTKLEEAEDRSLVPDSAIEGGEEPLTPRQLGAKNPFPTKLEKAEDRSLVTDSVMEGGEKPLTPRRLGAKRAAEVVIDMESKPPKDKANVVGEAGDAQSVHKKTEGVQTDPEIQES